MARESLRLGVVQMTSVDDLDRNLAAVADYYLDGVGRGAELIVFPENTLYFRIGARRPLAGPAEDGAEFARLSRLVDRSGVPMMLTTAVPTNGRKFLNQTILFRPGAPAANVYAKIHLFDVDVNGAPPVRESDQFTPGTDPAVIEVAGWRIGLSVCYDLRFSELYRRYAQAVDLILVPSAFLVPTGQAHWHVLLRARAIETQCFVAAPAQVGAHVSDGDRRLTFGHALVVDPWGQVRTDLKERTGIEVVELRREDLDRVRAQIPMANHRRL